MQNNHSFTLIELLTVIVIIMILAGMLLPALASARGHSHGIACLSLMKQYGTATSLYADDFSDFFPDIRRYLLPQYGFATYLGGTMTEKLTRCPADGSTASLGRLGQCNTLRISIGGTSNLTDSQTQTRNGPARINQSRTMPQNKHPSRRCLWTDYQNQSEDKEISGAALDIWKGATQSNSLHQYVFRHNNNTASGAFADGHAAVILLSYDISTTNGGHNLADGHTWILPANNTYPYGPRQIAAPGMPGDIDNLTDTPNIRY